MMHGHAPRVRRKYNQGEEEEEIVIKVNPNELISQTVTAGLGALVATAATRAVYRDNNGR